MKSNYYEKEIIDFLHRFEQNQVDKIMILDFIRKLANGFVTTEKKYKEEIHLLKKNIASKNLQVSTILLNSIEKQEFLNLIVKSLNELKDLDDGKYFKGITRLQNLILNNSVLSEDSWNFFNNHFLSQHNIDLKNILSSYNLSDTEFKICSLIFLDFTTKDISKILNISLKSVESQKYRIKKKIGLGKETKLNTFISNLIRI